MNLDAVVARITPTPMEREAEAKLLERIIDLLKPYPVEPVIVGSYAKDTDLSGNKDLDVFIQFKASTSRQELETEGLRIGKDVLSKLGVEYEIDYAEHPYVKGTLREHTIEIVPCYMGAGIMSAVDRTPMHTSYVRSRITGTGLNREIRLLKQFMRGISVYGAEAKVEGFSGYLVELLTIRYGSFIQALEAAMSWRTPIVLDIEGLWDDPTALPKFFPNAGLIVVDPVDRTRNVAAAVSRECLSKFQLKAHEYVLQPSEEFFFPTPKPVRKAQDLREALEARGSRFMAVVFSHGKLNANTLYSQLKKTVKSVSAEFKENEFRVFRSAVWTNERDISALLFEFEDWQLPELVHRLGPPIDADPANQEKFNEKYAGERPYVMDDRWVVDARRRHRTPDSLLEVVLAERRGFGKNLRGLGKPAVMQDSAVLEVDGQEWLRFLGDYLG